MVISLRTAKRQRQVVLFGAWNCGWSGENAHEKISIEAGRYEVWASTTSGGPYSLAGSTADKAVPSILITGLSPALTYYFVVRTVTDPNPDNQNTVTSEFSAEIPTPMSAHVLNRATDLNGDGNADILWRNSETGQLYVWLMNGMLPPVSAVLGAVSDLSWTIQR